MLAFVLRRLLTLIPLLLAVTLLVAILMHVAPGDALDGMRADPSIPQEYVQEMERQFMLVNEEGEPTSWYVRYWAWLKNAVQLDFGRSVTYRIPVTDLIGQRVFNTFILSLTSILFAWAIAIPLGVLAAIYKDSIWDRISAFLAYAALSIPEFFLAILAVYFAAVTGLFPTGGATSVEADFAPWYLRGIDFAYHLILPTIVLGIGSVAGMMRIMRANFIDYMRADFVTTARAKGLSERMVMFKHVLRNAVNPLITSFGFAFSTLLSGALLVENVMNYPGLGQLIFQSIVGKDTYVVMAAVLMSVTMLVLGNLLADILLAWSDPRIRLGGQKNTVGKGVAPWKIALWACIALALVAAEIAIEAFVPGVIPTLVNILKWGGIAVGAVIALACVFAVGYAAVLIARNYFKPILRRPMGFFSVSVLGVLYFFALFAHFIAPYDPNHQNLSRAFHPPTKIVWDDGLAVQAYRVADASEARYEAIPGKTYRLDLFAKAPEAYRFLWLFDTHWKLFQIDADEPEARVYLLGSDTTGRDVFSRLLYGSQISLSVGLVGIAITMTLGFLIGGIAGYYGGTVDFVLMRLVELLMSLPGLYLLLTLREALITPEMDPGEIYFYIIVILSIIGWAGAARVIRGMSLSIRGRQFVTAAEAMGEKPLTILVRHVLPNLASYLLVAATLSIPGYILGEAALSFLGLGISEPAVSWGLMLKQSQGDMKVFFLGFWWLLMPGFMIFLTVIAFNLLGDVLRDVVDPRMKM